MALFLECGCHVSDVHNRMVDPCEAHRQMALRDHFAGQALNGLCAATGDYSAPEVLSEDVLAAAAYAIADAMLRARKALA